MPPSRSHLAPFLEGPRPWLVLARNAIPIVGIYALGWSSSVAVFQIWFDGIAALALMFAFQVLAIAIREPDYFRGGFPTLVGAWLFLLGLLGFPYWFTLLVFSTQVFPEGFWALLLLDTDVLIALGLVVVCNAVEEFTRGYFAMDDEARKREFNWDFNMHLARICAMLIVAAMFGSVLVVALAVALSYVEIYPMRALRILGGDATLDEGNKLRSAD